MIVYKANTKTPVTGSEYLGDASATLPAGSPVVAGTSDPGYLHVNWVDDQNRLFVADVPANHIHLVSELYVGKN